MKSVVGAGFASVHRIIPRSQNSCADDALSFQTGQRVGRAPRRLSLIRDSVGVPRAASRGSLSTSKAGAGLRARVTSISRATIFLALAGRYGAELIVDEAHATGVMGPRRGRGLVSSVGAARQVFAAVAPRAGRRWLAWEHSCAVRKLSSNIW